MNDRAPFIISFPNSQPVLPQEDTERWKTEDAPVFPKPFRMAPPKQPFRQDSESNSKAFAVLAAEESCHISPPPEKPGKSSGPSSSRAAPRRGGAFRIHRMLQAAKTINTAETASSGMLSPPQRPDRQESVAKLLLADSCHSSVDPRFTRSTSQDETTTTANEDETSSLDGNELEKLHDSKMSVDESFRDLCPCRPTRQQTCGSVGVITKALKELHVVTDEVDSKNETAAPQQPAWTKLWESQAQDSNGSQSNFWEV